MEMSGMEISIVTTIITIVISLFVALVVKLMVVVLDKTSKPVVVQVNAAAAVPKNEADIAAVIAIANSQ